MGNVADDIEAIDTALLQQEGGVAVFFGVDGDQDVEALDLVFAGASDVHDRALHHALKAARGSDLHAVVVNLFELFPQKFLEGFFQPCNVGTALLEHIGGFVVVQQGEGQMFDGGVLMLPTLSVVERDADRDFDVLRQHDSASLKKTSCCCARRRKTHAL